MDVYNFIAVSVFTFLMNNDVEHLSMCLLGIYMSYFVKYLFKSFNHFILFYFFKILFIYF